MVHHSLVFFSFLWVTLSVFLLALLLLSLNLRKTCVKSSEKKCFCYFSFLKSGNFSMFIISAFAGTQVQGLL